MSIISDALKKVEGNSAPSKPMKREAPQVELVDTAPPASSPPLFSVWSIVLSTIMVLTAAILLFVTWYMNRPRRPAEPAAAPASISPPVEVAAVPEPELPATATPSTPAPVDEPEPEPEAEPMAKTEGKPAEPVVEAASPPEAPPAEAEPAEASPVSAPVTAPPVQPAEKPAPKPTPKPSRKGDELVLTGVVYAPRVRMAHINGKILPEGAEIQGYRIVTVSRESVRLSKDDKFYILRLKR
jgi:hypothetical protein